MSDLLKRFRDGDLRAFSRLITLAENRDEAVLGPLKALFADTGKARVLGLTGPPGAGKSTLTGELISRIRKRGGTVAVVAVDPMSPFTGGALLGDRIRLGDHFNDPGVFIRSLSTRGRLGGLSLATREVVQLADAFGFDYILLETVGVGQSEVDVRRVADLTTVIVVPEWGDGIQAQKAGLLEIGDIFVVNKADRGGADKLRSELETRLEMTGKHDVSVLTTTFKDPGSVEAFFGKLEDNFEAREELIRERRRARTRETVRELLEASVGRELRKWVGGRVEDCENPYAFLEEFRKSHPEGSLFK